MLPPSLLLFPYKGWADWSPTARVQRGSSNFFYLSLGEWPRLHSTARINDPSKLARYSFHGMAPVLVPLRPSSEHILIVRAPGARDRHGCHSILSSCAFCEQGGHLAAPPHPPTPGRGAKPAGLVSDRTRSFLCSGIFPFYSGISPQLTPPLSITNHITFTVITHCLSSLLNRSYPHLQARHIPC